MNSFFFHLMVYLYFACTKWISCSLFVLCVYKINFVFCSYSIESIGVVVHYVKITAIGKYCSIYYITWHYSFV